MIPSLRSSSYTVVLFLALSWLVGIAPAAAQTVIIDDGDTGYSTTGSWTMFGGDGAFGDFDYATAVEGGTDTAEWSETGLTPGLYRVSVTWAESGNRPVDAPYTVVDGAIEFGPVIVDQTAAPDDFFEDVGGGEIVDWEDLGSFAITGTTLTVRLSSDGTGVGNPNVLVIADAVRFERTGDLPTGPEVRVTLDGTPIVDGTGSVDFGFATVGEPVTEIITVENWGVDDLSLGTITVPAGFSVASGFGSTLLTSGESTDFSVQMDADVEGMPSGTASFVTNDADENPFDFTVFGEVSLLPPAVTVLDDGDAGYSTTAGWSMFGGGGAFGDFDFIAAEAAGAETATWDQDGLVAGLYRVSVTWDAFTNRPVDAPYTVLDGATELGTVAVDQTAAPGDFSDGGVDWDDIGSYQLTGDTLTVRLSNDATPIDATVVADAVRFERTSTPPTVTITSPTDGGSAIAGTSLDLIATADDAEEGDLTASIAWTSDLDGPLGTGGSILGVTTLSVGVHTLTATATDTPGLSGSDVVTFTIDPNTAPTVTITSPTTGGSAIEGTPVDLIATASDTESGDLTAAIAWTSDLDGPLGTGGSILGVTTLSVGVHTLTASVSDPQGLPGSDVVTFTIDANTAPTVAITSPTTGGSTIEGTPVDLIATASDTESGDLTAAIAWTSDLDGPLGTGGSILGVTTLSVGVHTLTASVSDPQGLPGSDVVTFTIDANTAPTVAITSPTTGGSATEGTPVDLIATAFDAESGDATAFITWESDLDGPLGTGGSLLGLTNLSVGVHTLTASVNDPQGLSGSDVVTFTIDANTAPTVAITSPTTGGSAIEGTPIDLIATANDAEEGDLTAAIAWESDLDGPLGTGGSLLGLTNLSVGVHTLTASVNDPQGLSGSDVVTFTIDANTAPTVAITSPTTGGSAIEGTPIDLIATANDAEEGDLTAAIAWESDLDGPLGTGGSLLGLTNLSVGVHTLTASVNDPQGLSGSDVVTFTIDANTAPTVAITSPTTGGSAIEGTPIDLIATANDAEEGDLTAAIAWESDLDGPLGTGGSLLGLTNLSVGVHTLTASVNDPQGLSGSDVVTFTIFINTAPTVAITSPTDGGSATEATPIDLIATAFDAESGDATAFITWESNLDGPLGTGGSLLGLTNLSVGVHTLTASVNDPLGLSGSDAVTFTIAANTAPTVAITSPTAGGSVTEGTPVDLIATATDAEEGDLTAEIAWTSDLDGPLGTGGSVLGLTDLSVGEHTLTAEVTDGLGLPGSDVVTFTIAANTAPTVAITSPTNGGSATEGTPVDLIATATDAEEGDLTTEIAWTSDLDGPLGTGGSLLGVTDLSVGEHTLTAEVTDGLGLPGSDVVIFSVPEPAAAATSVAALAAVLSVAAVRRERSRTNGPRS